MPVRSGNRSTTSVLYAAAVGASQVVLLLSVTFWTWLWGPLGLLLTSSLTVCLVVLGKRVPALAARLLQTPDKHLLRAWTSILSNVAAVTAGVVSLQGCATLPNAERDMAVPHVEQVEFDGAQGPVSEARSDAIIDHL